MDASGQPAAHRDAYLRGWERGSFGPPMGTDDITGAPGPETLAQARQHGWLFTTDAKGDITVKLGDFVPWKDKLGRPGWGTYALLIERGPMDAGGVSQRFCFGTSKGVNAWAQNWGDVIPASADGLRLTMVLSSGYTLRGRVWDFRNPSKPIPHCKIKTWNDLSIETHTGLGGEIFSTSIVTDENGEFKIEHEFFQPLHVSFDGLWMTSNNAGTWVEQEDDVLPAPMTNDRPNLEVRVLTNGSFHYNGRVVDAHGSAVAGADVVIGISSQPQAISWGDTHHFEHATTDANGNYDLAASSPWGTFLEAETKQLGRVDLKWPAYDAPPIPPGHYDLVFPASQKSN